MQTIENRKSKIEHLKPLVEAETGMDFSGSRFSRLCDAVEKLIAKTGDATLLDRLLASQHESGPILERLTTELTVGESFFFRNEHHFQALREQVIPEILRDNADRDEIRVWSAGCATGEEPYSLAILLDQILNDRNSKIKNQKWQISILATDIDPDFLRRARKAEYRSWSFRRTDIYQDPNYFTTTGDRIRLTSPVRDRVRFVYLNLVKDVYPSPLNGTTGLDLILFRNVAIYLHPEVVAAIVQRFHRCLRPGGWLLLGEAEVSQVRPDDYDVRRIGDATFFQKPRIETPPATPPAEPPLPVLLPGYDAEVTCGAGVAPARSAETAAPQEKPPQAKPVPMLVTPPLFDWQQVELCLLHEDYDAAESTFNTIRDRRQRATMKLKLVRRLLDLSQTTRARETLDACLELEPLMIDGHLLKACLAEERGHVAEADAACRRALYLDRNCVMAHFHLALLQQQRGDVTGAGKSLALVEKLSKSHDANALVAHGDGVCYGRLSELARSMIGS